MQAGARLVENHEAVVKFSLRGPGRPGYPPVSAPLADPNASAAMEYLPAADAGDDKMVMWRGAVLGQWRAGSFGLAAVELGMVLQFETWSCNLLQTPPVGSESRGHNTAQSAEDSTLRQCWSKLVCVLPITTEVAARRPLFPPAVAHSLLIAAVSCISQ